MHSASTREIPEYEIGEDLSELLYYYLFNFILQSYLIIFILRLPLALHVYCSSSSTRDHCIISAKDTRTMVEYVHFCLL